MILQTRKAGRRFILSFVTISQLLRFLFLNGAYLSPGDISCRQEVLSVSISKHIAIRYVFGFNAGAPGDVKATDAMQKAFEMGKNI